MWWIVIGMMVMMILVMEMIILLTIVSVGVGLLVTIKSWFNPDNLRGD